MSNLKFDANTKFKWIDYSGEPLASNKDNLLKRVIQSKYVELLNAILKDLKLAPCSANVSMLTDLILNNKRYTTNPLFGTYTEKQREEAIEKSSFPDDIKNTLHELVDKITIGLGLDFDIEDIKKKFRECANQSLFIVSLNATPTRNISSGETYFTHANILVIAKNRGIVYWIEPQTTIDPTYETRMIESIKKLVTDIGMVDPTIINPVDVCPQSITNDQNCMFWAYIIFTLIMLNPTVRDHNVLVKQFLEKYPTKEALTKYIDGFKQQLVSQLTSAGLIGAKRSRKRRMYKKHKTLRRK